jgi:hypothetical protein
MIGPQPRGVCRQVKNQRIKWDCGLWRRARTFGHKRRNVGYRKSHHGRSRPAASPDRNAVCPDSPTTARFWNRAEIMSMSSIQFTIPNRAADAVDFPALPCALTRRTLKGVLSRSLKTTAYARASLQGLAAWRVSGVPR